MAIIEVDHVTKEFQLGQLRNLRQTLLDLAARITQVFALDGLYDFDVMTNTKGDPIPIEINPRPSGSIAAAILAGVPFYDDLIALANGSSIADVALPDERTTVVPYLDCHIVASRMAR